MQVKMPDERSPLLKDVECQKPRSASVVKLIAGLVGTWSYFEDGAPGFPANLPLSSQVFSSPVQTNISYLLSKIESQLPYTLLLVRHFY